MTAALLDLPAAVPDRSVTFLHTADWQIGMTRHFLGADAAHAYAQARQDAIGRIGRLAAECGAEFVVVCGDVFEDDRVPAKAVRRTLDQLAGFDVPVFLLPGNHDPADPAGIYASRVFLDECPDNVRVLADPGVVEVREGIELVAAPWAHKRPLDDLVSAQVDLLDRSDALRIVVGHGGAVELSPADDPALVSTTRLERALGDELVDYVALGDRHSMTDVGESGRIWYAGAHEVTDFDHVESDPGHVLAVTLRRGAQRTVEVIPHRVGRWRFHGVRREITGAADIEALRAELEAVDDKPSVVLKLGLTGTVSVSDDAALTEMLAGFADRFAALTRWARHDHLVVLADDVDVDDLGLAAYARAAAQELLSDSRSDDDAVATAARDALGLLRRLSAPAGASHTSAGVR